MKFVAYFRVSTDKQQQSGLGLDAQRAKVQAYIAQTNGELLAEFSDAISGATDDRSNLNAALRFCEQHKATLVIAKLDRLARRLSFIANFLESKVPLVVAEMPQASKMHLQMMAVFAEAERDMISERTKDALAEAKLRGVKLGNPKLEDARKKGLKKRQKRANDFANLHLPVALSMRHRGATLQEIANHLNQQGTEGRYRGRWWPKTIDNLLARAPLDTP